LAGPVVAASVILDPQRPLAGLRDSKQLTPEQREQLATAIRQHALAFAVVFVDAETIDRINILQASLQAMRESLLALCLRPELALIDGNRLPHGLPFPALAIVKGDASESAIAAASILAKVARDHWMRDWDTREPQYGFAKHMGYPTPFHLRALEEHGHGLIHRKSFAPVRRCLARAGLR